MTASLGYGKELNERVGRRTRARPEHRGNQVGLKESEHGCELEKPPASYRLSAITTKGKEAGTALQGLTWYQDGKERMSWSRREDTSAKGTRGDSENRPLGINRGHQHISEVHGASHTSMNSRARELASQQKSRGCRGQPGDQKFSTFCLAHKTREEREENS